MTSRKLWVLKAHTKTDKIDDVCQNIRQDLTFTGTSIIKKQRNEERNKHKQTSDQTNKHTTKRRKPHGPFFFVQTSGHKV